VACTWIDVPQAAHTHAVLLSRPWWMWGAEMGANEHGVVIGNEAVFTTAEPGDKALLGMDLLRLALERADTAEAAVSVMVELLEHHGQGGPCSYERPEFSYDNSFLVADPDGAFVLETAGSRWATEVVTGPGRSISNGLTIPAFAKAHGRAGRTWLSSASTRRARTEPLACCGHRPRRPHGGPPGPRDDHGAALVPGPRRARRPLRPCRGPGGLEPDHGVVGVRPAAGDPPRDPALGHRHLGTVHVTVQTGGRGGAPRPHARRPPTVFDARSMWWRHELLHRSTMAAHSTLMPRYRYARDRTESRWIAEPPPSASAFREAEWLERRWLGDVAAAHLPDNRPLWVRRAWKAIDRAAGLDRPVDIDKELHS
jgi:secernin